MSGKKPSAQSSKQASYYKLVAENRAARRNYEILDTYEAGIELRGTEVKSAFLGNANLKDGWARIKDGEAFLEKVHIAKHDRTGEYDNHEPLRSRKLLLHKREIRKLEKMTATKGLTLVPLRLYFNESRKLKVLISLARGKNTRDKRDDIKKKEAKKDMARAIKNSY
eukprot:CAMPEP_0117761848 /NCGR_PEP_ID=MMETSP0947-20121206/17529_1 /TAXON_ID=44440 /ORGANISM="Chattonella subsalsa, Strain CCMP2191" /LENGTH=166 /DNA_ID=CAMNT_0005582927 /DNA_START=116 /DNA_END=616 /DNA_ORIENTATION=+